MPLSINHAAAGSGTGVVSATESNSVNERESPLKTADSAVAPKLAIPVADQVQNSSCELEQATVVPAAADDALYTMGLTLAYQLRQNGVTDLPLKRIDQGIKNGLSGKKPTAADQMRVQAFLNSSAAAAAAKNTAAAHEFLERNAKSSGVTTTASGLQYRNSTAP
jgi:FKBP-type peptidyl-prolyl cis-trans isomerase FklB